MFESQHLQTPIARRQPVLRMVLVLSMGALVSTAAPPAQAAADQQQTSLDTRLLVQQLGDSRFTARARATRLLTEMGSPGIPALRQGLKSPHREVRIRSARILSIVEKRDLEQRLHQFLIDRDSKVKLTGWEEFRRLAGDSGDSRALFVQMYRDEPFLMQSVDATPKTLSQHLSARVGAMRAGLGYNFAGLKLGTVAAMYFLSSRPGIQLADPIAVNIGSLGNYSSFQTAINTNGKRQILRRLLGNWIKSGIEPTYAFSHASRFELTEGIELAERVLKGQLPANVHVRHMAITTLAKLGGPQHVPLLETLLTDTTQVTSSTTRTRVQYRTQIRDVALATILTLTDQDHHSLGFDHISFDSDRVFRSSSVGFVDDKARGKVFDAYRALTSGKPRPKVPPAAGSKQPN